MRYTLNNFKKAVRRGSLIILLGLSLGGCESLDFANPNSPSVESATLRTLIAGAEAGMRVDYAIYLQEVSVVGREAYYFEPADPRYTGELLTGEIDPGGFLLNRPWSARYNVVKNATILIDKVASSDLNTAEQAGINGFAGTIIAYQLLLNLNLMDENGIKLDFSGVLDNFATKDESFTAIEKYLDDAATDLGNAGSSFWFELSSGFAGYDTPATFLTFNRAIRARVAVYQQDWAAALTALDASFLDAAGSLNEGVYHVYSSGAGDQINEIYENPEASFVKFMVHPSFEADADTNDTRLDAKSFKRGTSTLFNELTSDRSVTIVTGSSDPLPIIRNEELILLRAEANIGSGNYTLAQADIDIIRAEYGLAASVTLTATNAVDLLLYEKRYSLFCEGHRWVDMRNYSKLGDLPTDLPAHAVPTNFPRPETEVSG